MALLGLDVGFGLDYWASTRFGRFCSACLEFARVAYICSDLLLAFDWICSALLDHQRPSPSNSCISFGHYNQSRPPYKELLHACASHCSRQLPGDPAVDGTSIAIILPRQLITPDDRFDNRLDLKLDLAHFASNLNV